MSELVIGDPALVSDKQIAFFMARKKHVGFGGARGGGKSWAVRAKAKMLAMRYPGIRQLIVRRTYPELVNNHITQLRTELIEFARYNDKDKVLRFRNGSSIHFMYCAKDQDLDRLQGVEYDIIFFDEATQLTEHQMRTISACLRGANDFPKRIYYTMNPGGQGHAYIKRIFIDRRFEADEDPDEYEFIQSLVTDNKALMQAQPDYVKQLDSLPPKLRDAWRYGKWDIFEGQFFEEFRLSPDIEMCAKLSLTPEQALQQRRCTHVIEPFEPPREWTLYRSFDWGYSKPFSCAWWAVDFDGRLYRILELYGCTKIPNEGVKWTPLQVFREIRRIEETHPWLKGRTINGVADPAIWDASTGESIAETASKCRVYFSPGDHERIPGWMQCHYRLAFDEHGYPMMYVFRNCEAFIRTVPLMVFDATKVEDLDTANEDHVCDEWRYLCMARPISPVMQTETKPILSDPLDTMKTRRFNQYGTIR